MRPHGSPGSGCRGRASRQVTTIPLLPYLALYLAGAALGTRWSRKGYPEWAYRAHVAPLNFVGRHALLVYIAHQPVILGICVLAGAL